MVGVRPEAKRANFPDFLDPRGRGSLAWILRLLLLRPTSNEVELKTSPPSPLLQLGRLSNEAAAAASAACLKTELPNQSKIELHVNSKTIKYLKVDIQY